MPTDQEQLQDDADALDRVAQAAEWLAGLARQDGDVENADRVDGEAALLRAWAEVCRAVAG